MWYPTKPKGLLRTVCAAAVLLLMGQGAGAKPDYESLIDSPLFADKTLAAHNTIRSKVGVPPLVWSSEMARLAKDWANTLIATGEFAHRPMPKFGENIYEITGGNATPDRVVNAWASEEKNYMYSANVCSGDCGHYTQVIWHDTKEVGCAAAGNGDREIWVCNYAPFGNIIGQRPY